MVRLTFIVSLVLLVSLTSTPCSAAGNDFLPPPIFLPIGEAAKPPTEWADYCARYRECSGQSKHVPTLDLDLETWLKLVSVNTWANASIKAETDMAHWGVADRWDDPEDGFGDCEDIAILKRQALIGLGLPEETLLLTVVWDKDNAGHAVLTAHTSQGDLILDNRTSSILMWSDTGYDFVKRQSQADPNQWVYVDGLTWPAGTRVAAVGVPGSEKCALASCVPQTAAVSALLLSYP